MWMPPRKSEMDREVQRLRKLTAIGMWITIFLGFMVVVSMLYGALTNGLDAEWMTFVVLPTIAFFAVTLIFMWVLHKLTML